MGGRAGGGAGPGRNSGIGNASSFGRSLGPAARGWLKSGATLRLNIGSRTGAITRPQQKLLKAAGASYGRNPYTKQGQWSISVTGVKGFNAVNKQLNGFFVSSWNYMGMNT